VILLEMTHFVQIFYSNSKKSGVNLSSTHNQVHPSGCT